MHVIVTVPKSVIGTKLSCDGSNGKLGVIHANSEGSGESAQLHLP